MQSLWDCRWLLSGTFRVLQGPPEVCQGGPGTMPPIWKQLLLRLNYLMDGEISLGCPAKPADRDAINHPPPVPTDGDLPQLRPLGQGFCQGISSSLHSSRWPQANLFDHLEYVLMLGVLIVHLLVAKFRHSLLLFYCYSLLFVYLDDCCWEKRSNCL